MKFANHHIIYLCSESTVKQTEQDSGKACISKSNIQNSIDESEMRHTSISLQAVRVFSLIHGHITGKLSI